MKNEDEKVMELLKPRYKVIADYPGNQFKKGVILTEVDVDIYDNGVYRYYLPDFFDNDFEFKKYPHLFQPLHWSEGITLEQMPQYVKFYNNHLDGPSFGKVLKWELRTNGGLPIVKTDVDSTRRELYFMDMPATEQEYLEYINKKP